MNDVLCQKPVTSLTEMDKILFAANSIAGVIKSEWKAEDKRVAEDSARIHTYKGYCAFLQERMMPAHVRQAEVTVKIGKMRQCPNQSMQSLIAALNELEN